MTNPRIAIDIVANDKSGKGVDSAEKKLGTIPKHAGIANKRLADAERTVGRSSRGILKTLTGIEQAGSRAFGNASLTSGFVSRLGALGQAGAIAGEGLGGAAEAGGLLSGVVGGLGVAVAGTVGLLAAAGYAAFKLADGWAKGASSMGHMAETIGVGAKELQEFQAAAERVGVDKDKAAGTLGGLSQTLNDARYGRNTQALAVLSRLGVAMKLNEDGTVNVGAMLPAIATAIARQNSSGRRTAARALGIDLAALPAFAQGGQQLAADMKDADTHAVVLTPGEIERGKRISRKGAMVGQLKDRAMSAAGGWTADKAEGGYDAVLSGATQLTDAIQGHFEPGAEKIDRGGRAIERAANRLTGVSGAGSSGLKNGVLNVSDKDILDLKKAVATEWDKRSLAQGRGVIDTILNRQASGHWGRTVSDVVNARSQFSNVNGPVAWRQGRHSVDGLSNRVIDRRTNDLVDQHLLARARGARSSIGDNLNYANPNYSDARNQGWINRLNGPVLGEGRSVHRHGTTPELERFRPGGFQVGLGGEQRHVHEIKIEDHRTTARSSTNGGAPSVSYAYAPVRGG